MRNCIFEKQSFTITTLLSILDIALIALNEIKCSKGTLNIFIIIV